MYKKYGMNGTILMTLMLMTFSILSPYAAAETLKDAGNLTMEAYSPGCSPVATATGDYSDPTFVDNPVNVTVDWEIDDYCGNYDVGGPYGLILNVTNQRTAENDRVDMWFAYNGWPVVEDGTIDAQVDGKIGDYIQIFIYCNMTVRGAFVEDYDYFIVQLT